MIEEQLCNKCENLLEKDQFKSYEWDKPSHYSRICKSCLLTKQDLDKLLNATKSGEIYIITNPAWPEWRKIGMTTTSPEHRLTTYQTNTPHRDYAVEFSMPTSKVSYAEHKVHSTLKEIGYENSSEWFKISNDDAVAIIQQVLCIIASK